MITIALSAISLALAGSTPDAGAAPAAQPPAAAESTAAKRYCVKETPTGSILGNKVCRTRDEWLKKGYDPIARK